MKSESKGFVPGYAAMPMPFAACMEMKKDTNRTPELDAELMSLADGQKRLIDSICRAACPCSGPDRKDLRQEILIRALESYPRFRHESTFSTWLYKVAINTASVWRRKMRNKKIEFSESVPDMAEETPAVTDGDDRINRLFGQVDFFGGAILALMLEGHENKEIGELLGISPEAVRKRLLRLKKQITDY